MSDSIRWRSWGIAVVAGIAFWAWDVVVARMLGVEGMKPHLGRALITAGPFVGWIFAHRFLSSPRWAIGPFRLFMGIWMTGAAVIVFHRLQVTPYKMPPELDWVPLLAVVAWPLTTPYFAFWDGSLPAFVLVFLAAVAHFTLIAIAEGHWRGRREYRDRRAARSVER